MARSLAPDVVRPPRALRRRARAAGHRVPAHARSHPSERVEQATGEGSTVGGRLVPPGCPTGFQRRRSYGVPAPTPVAPVQGRLEEAVAPVQGSIKGASPRIAPLTSRPRSPPRTGRAPFRDPPWHRALGVGRRWHPPDGMLQAALDTLRRGKEASQAPRAAPTGGPGRPLWPAAGGVALARPGLGGSAGGPGRQLGGRERGGQIARGIYRRQAHDGVSRRPRRD